MKKSLVDNPVRFSKAILKMAVWYEWAALKARFCLSTNRGFGPFPEIVVEDYDAHLGRLVFSRVADASVRYDAWGVNVKKRQWQREVLRFVWMARWQSSIQHRLHLRTSVIIGRKPIQ